MNPLIRDALLYRAGSLALTLGISYLLTGSLEFTVRFGGLLIFVQTLYYVGFHAVRRDR